MVAYIYIRAANRDGGNGWIESTIHQKKKATKVFFSPSIGAVTKQRSTAAEFVASFHWLADYELVFVSFLYTFFVELCSIFGIFVNVVKLEYNACALYVEEVS